MSRKDSDSGDGLPVRRGCHRLEVRSTLSFAGRTSSPPRISRTGSPFYDVFRRPDFQSAADVTDWKSILRCLSQAGLPVRRGCHGQEVRSTMSFVGRTSSPARMSRTGSPFYVVFRRPDFQSVADVTDWKSVLRCLSQAGLPVRRGYHGLEVRSTLFFAGRTSSPSRMSRTGSPFYVVFRRPDFQSVADVTDRKSVLRCLS